MFSSGIDTEIKKIMTIERHILQEERRNPGATGVLTSLLYDLALAGKVISSKTTRAGLAEILGETNEVNVQGEQVKKLDMLADRVIYRLNDHTGRLAALGSEENAEIMQIPEQYPVGRYILLYDPLDGSSNIDYCVPVGTIFSIYRRKSDPTTPISEEDCLQTGREIVAAGYILYGTSTMLVYSTGNGVHGFTLESSVGEFLLSHPNIRMPEKPQYFSTNIGNYNYWSPGVQSFTRFLQGYDGGVEGLSMRYIGSMVADFHRNLLAGGVFYYPADSKDPSKPHGKLRMMYECLPLSFIAHQAGGHASTGHEDILDVKPTELHQRSPLFIGNRYLVEKAEEFIREHDGK
jgi:fructose-1,6-bisphosphatase I